MFTLTQEITSNPIEINGRVQNFKRLWPDLASREAARLERAETIATTPGAVLADPARPGCYLVRSESNALGNYQVNPTAKTCTCPDHGKHAAAGVVCKHRLAVALAVGWAAAPAPEAKPKPPTLEDIARQLSEITGTPTTAADILAVADGSSESTRRIGYVSYAPPMRDRVLIPVLASREFLVGAGRPMIDVMAIHGEPFSCMQFTRSSELFPPSLVCILHEPAA